jgi:3-oxoacyl-[acyl-carrier protein] reductase
VSPAARGIGAAAATRFAADGRQEAGPDLDESACAALLSEIEAADGMALAVGVGLSGEEAVRAAVERAATEVRGYLP